jgi:hypothetical protein
MFYVVIKPDKCMINDFSFKGMPPREDFGVYERRSKVFLKSVIQLHPAPGLYARC